MPSNLFPQSIGPSTSFDLKLIFHLSSPACARHVHWVSQSRGLPTSIRLPGITPRPRAAAKAPCCDPPDRWLQEFGSAGIATLPAVRCRVPPVAPQHHLRRSSARSSAQATCGEDVFKARNGRLGTSRISRAQAIVWITKPERLSDIRAVSSSSS